MSSVRMTLESLYLGNTLDLFYKCASIFIRLRGPRITRKLAKFIYEDFSPVKTFVKSVVLVPTVSSMSWLQEEDEPLIFIYEAI